MTDVEAATTKNVDDILGSDASDGLKIAGLLGIIALLLSTFVTVKGDQT